MYLKDGIPTIADYRALKASTQFQEMERFSNKFLLDNKRHLKYYIKKWSKDPLHQWSREYEYPFVLQKVGEYLDMSESSEVKVLDAGSGVTFFPFMLLSRYANLNITCCDYDGALNRIYEDLSRQLAGKIEFRQTDIHALPFPDSAFDIVYCISVLEHTRDYSQVLDEFKRVLKPNGKLIVTFDISIDGKTDISIDEAENLLAEVKARFGSAGSAPSIRLADFSDKLKTEYFRVHSPALLPWKFSLSAFIRGLFTSGVHLRKFFNLSFYCFSATK